MKKELTHHYYASVPIVLPLSLVVILLGLLLLLLLLQSSPQSSYSQTIEDKLKIAPLQNLCGPQYGPCVDVIHETTHLIVLKGDEVVPNTKPGGGEVMINPGFWKIVDFYINKGYVLNTVLSLETDSSSSNSVNSYRVILNK